MEYSTGHLYCLGIYTRLDIPWYHERALLDSFIPCHSGQDNQCDIRAAHDWKVEYNTVEYTTAFLYSDWLYIFYGMI